MRWHYDEASELERFWMDASLEGDATHLIMEMREVADAFDKLKRHCSKTGTCGVDVARTLLACEHIMKDLVPQFRGMRDMLEQQPYKPGRDE